VKADHRCVCQRNAVNGYGSETQGLRLIRDELGSPADEWGSQPQPPPPRIIYFTSFAGRGRVPSAPSIYWETWSRSNLSTPSTGSNPTNPSRSSVQIPGSAIQGFAWLFRQWRDLTNLDDRLMGCPHTPADQAF